MFDVIAEESAVSGYRGCRFANAAAELPDPTHPARLVASAHKAAVLDLITSRAVRLGVADPARLARQLKVLLEGAIATALVDPGGQPARDARSAAATLLEAVLSVKDQPNPKKGTRSDGRVRRSAGRAGPG